MPIPLFSIPSHISASVIQKFDLSEFVNFYQSSLKSLDAAVNVKTRFTIENPINFRKDGTAFSLPLRLDLKYSNERIMMKFKKSNQSYSSYLCKPFRNDLCHFPVRFQKLEVLVNGVLSDAFCISLINFIKNNCSSMNFIVFYENMICSPNSLRLLAEIQNVKELRFHYIPPPEYTKIDEVENKAVFVINSMEQEEIFHLDALKFRINSSNLTSRGINHILKEILDDKRKIIEIRIGTNQMLQKKVIFKGIHISEKYSTYVYGISAHDGKKETYRVKIYDKEITITRIDQEK